jgi:nitroreductase
MTVWANERVALAAGVRQPERAETGTAAEFNFWCAVNSLPFQLVSHAWPDGSIEWGVEYAVGEPAETIAYGTGQQDEALAVLLAYAFAAGVEWGHATPDWRGDAVIEEDVAVEEDEEDDAVVPSAAASAQSPTPPLTRTLSPILARLSGSGIETPQRPKASAAASEPLSLSLPNEPIGLGIPPVEAPIRKLSLTLAAMGEAAPHTVNVTNQSVTHQRIGTQTVANQTIIGQTPAIAPAPAPAQAQAPIAQPVAAAVEVEEIEAVACALQNLQLSATAAGLGCYWSTPPLLGTKSFAEWLQIGADDRCVGLIYLGWPRAGLKWPQSVRQPVESKTRWCDE